MARLFSFLYGLVCIAGFQLLIGFAFVKLVSLGFMKHPVIDDGAEPLNKKLQPTADAPAE